MNFKHKAILIFLVALILIFLIYTVNADKKVRYVALGDSLAAGQNPYGEVGYGYTDYIANYLKKNDLLKEYTKEFAVSGHRTKDLKNDITNGKTVQKNKEDLNIKRALRESNLVTISIGANDFLEKLNLSIYNVSLPKTENLKKMVDGIMLDVDESCAYVRKYAKGRIIIIGYYNPISTVYAANPKQIDEIFAYIQEQYESIAQKYNAEYVDIYEAMKKDKSYLPNPFDIHPSIKGYEAIAQEIIEVLDKNVQN